MSQFREITEEYSLKKVLKTAPQTTVFQAERPVDGTAVALKLINPVGQVPVDGQRQRFQQAMKALVAGRPRSVAPALDFGLAPDGSAFLVSALMPGTVLTDVGPLTPDRLRVLLLQVAGGLDALARCGVVYRNLRPENILLATTKKGAQAFLLGLGTVAYLAEPEGTALIGQTRSSDPFAAPEIFDPELRHAEPWRTDLFAYAVLATHLLGFRVSGAGSPSPKLGVASEGISSALAELAARLEIALRREPEQRKVSFADIALALRSAPIEQPSPDLRLEPVPGGELGEAPTLDTAKVQVPADLGRPSERTAPPPAMAAMPDAGASPDLGVAAEEAGFETVAGANLGALLAEEERRQADAPPEPPPEPLSSGFEDFGTRLAPMEGSEPLDDLDMLSVDPLDLELGGALGAADGSDDATVTASVAAPVVSGKASEGGVAASAAAHAAPEPAAPPKSRAAGAGSQRLIVPAAIAVAVIVGFCTVAILTIWLLKSFGGPEATPEAVAMPTPAPTATPRPVERVPTPLLMHPMLAEAEKLMVEGDLEAAHETVSRIPESELALLTDQERTLYDEIVGEAALEDVDKTAGELRSGLQYGSVKMIRRAVTSLSSVDDELIGRTAGLREDLAQAQKVLDVHGDLWAAKNEGRSADVLRLAAQMLELLPGYSGATQLRESAAEDLKAPAEQAIKNRDFDLAIDHFEKLRELWPDAPGLADRIEWCRRQQGLNERLEGVLRTAQAKAAGGNPEEALKMLDSAGPTEAFKPRFVAASKLYQGQLDSMDAKAPEVSLAAGTNLQYRKDDTYRIPFTISDDYRVVEASIMVRPAGKAVFTQMALKHSGGSSYVFEVTPELHQNETVLFYVTATDRSGHQGLLGSAQQPLELERKKWYQR